MAVFPWPIDNMPNLSARPFWLMNGFKPYIYGSNMYAVIITGDNTGSSHSIQIYVSRNSGFDWKGIVEFAASRYIYSGDTWSQHYDTAASGNTLYIAYYAPDDKLTTRSFNMATENLAAPLAGSSVAASNSDAFPNIRLFLLPDLSQVITGGYNAGYVPSPGFYTDYRERYIMRPSSPSGSPWSSVQVIPFDYAGAGSGGSTAQGNLFCLAGTRLHSFWRDAFNQFWHCSVDISTGTPASPALVGDGSAYTANINPCPVTIGGQTNVMIVTGRPSTAQRSFHGVSGPVMSWTQLVAPNLTLNPDFRKNIPMGTYVESLCYGANTSTIQSYRFDGAWTGPFPLIGGTSSPVESVGGNQQGGNLQVIGFWGTFYWYLGQDRPPADGSLANFAY